MSTTHPGNDAGRTTTSPERAGTTAGAVRAWTDDADHAQLGDPVKAAAAMIATTPSADPPARLPLGADRRPALIVAHPGHETLLHHWLERTTPVVFVLTDGSGGAATARTEHSRRLVENVGASCGSVFGAAPDRRWYDALLARDAGPFRGAIGRIAAECSSRGVTTIVSDPIELYNPLHDLANAVAHAVARRIDGPCGESIRLLTYPIERPEALAARACVRVPLSGSAAARKRAAILTYHPLAGEYPRYEALATRDHELLAADRPGFAWPATPPGEPHYERFGRRRLREGRYGALITYADHVRPMALELLAGETAA